MFNVVPKSTLASLVVGLLAIIWAGAANADDAPLNEANSRVCYYNCIVAGGTPEQCRKKCTTIIAGTTTCEEVCTPGQEGVQECKTECSYSLKDIAQIASVRATEPSPICLLDPKLQERFVLESGAMDLVRLDTACSASLSLDIDCKWGCCERPSPTPWGRLSENGPDVGAWLMQHAPSLSQEQVEAAVDGSSGEMSNVIAHLETQGICIFCCTF